MAGTTNRLVYSNSLSSRVYSPRVADSAYIHRALRDSKSLLAVRI